MSSIQETSLNLVSEGSHVQGKIVFDQLSRVHGTLTGEVFAREGSMLVLAETALVEGNVHADTLVIDGYVKGDISAKTKVVISKTGRVIGNITVPKLVIEPGAYFEGRCLMDTARHHEKLYHEKL